MTTPELTPTDRYTVISVDGHAGAALRDYKPYLASKWHGEFDAWAGVVREPVRRPARLHRVPQLGQRRAARGDRIAGRRRRGAVPEHDPAVLRAGQPHRARADRRRLRAALGRPAGAQPLARRLLRGCAGPPGRLRAGVPQRPRRHARRDPLGEGATCTCSAGSSLPNVPPELGDRCRSGTRVYEPLWELCEELDVVINIHSGSGLPDFGEHEAARAIMLIELAWFAHRAVWHLIFGGVLERHPNLRVVLTEQGTSWIPRGLDTLDWFHRRMTHRRRGRGRVLRRRREGHVDDADRVLPAQLLGRRELPAPVGERAALRRRRRPHHVGRRLPALRGQLPLHDRGAARRVRRRAGRRGEA